MAKKPHPEAVVLTTGKKLLIARIEGELAELKREADRLQRRLWRIEGLTAEKERRIMVCWEIK